MPLATAALTAVGLRCSRADLDFAVAEVLARRAEVFYPFGEPSGLTEDERAVLTAGGADLEEHAPDAGDPLIRAAAEHAAILTSALTTAETARRLGVSEMRVRQRLAQHTLLGINTSKGWRIPSFQFTLRGELPGWGRVARQLPADVSPVELLSWLELPNPELRAGARELSPREWLASGHDPGAVVVAAEDLQNR